MKVTDLMATSKLNFMYSTEESKQRLKYKYAEDSDTDESFDLLKSYNDKIRNFHNQLLLEKALEVLAYNTSYKQIRRQSNNEAATFRRESLLLRAFNTIQLYTSIISKLERFRLRQAFNNLQEAVALSKKLDAIIERSKWITK